MAIAHDAAPTGSFVNPGTSHTQSHTCSGADRALVVGVASDGTDKITGATYAGAAMTLVDSGSSGGRWHHLFLLIAPATGTNNIVVSASSSSFIEINSSSYTGVSQTGQPEVFGKNLTPPASTGKSLSLTSVTDNAWMVMSGVAESGTLSAGAATTLRASALINALFDSGGPITPAGSRTLAFTGGGSSDTSAIGVILAPAAGGTSATASGTTVTAAASLIPGTATGAAGATAAGVTITAAASLLYAGGTLQFQAAGMEFGSRSGLGISTFGLDAAEDYRYTVHADGLVLGSALITSSVLATDSGGKLPNLVNTLIAPGVDYRVMAIRQADGEAATFRMKALA